MTTTPSQLLDRLDHIPKGRFPMQALREIVARKEEMIPHLVGVLASAAADPTGYLSGPKVMLCTYAAYLLAEFRETRAYHPLLALLNQEEGVPRDLFGDSIVEDMGKIIASVYDGDEGPLRELIENPSADGDTRACAGLEAYHSLIRSGKLTIGSVENYFRELFEGRLERDGSYVWDKLCSMSGDLGFQSLLPHIREASEEGLCDMWMDELEDIEMRAKGKGELVWLDDDPLIDDVIPLMSRWHCFGRQEVRKPLKQDPDLQYLLDDESELPATPPVSLKQAYPGVTRNDPCPCGSGRKFKKCCGG